MRQVASWVLGPMALLATQGGPVPAATPPAASGRSNVMVLVYHRLTPPGSAGDEERVPLDRFTAQMESLKAQGYQSLSLGELERILSGRERQPARAVAIHFDDGWRSAEPALPILRRLGLKASFLIISGAADGRFGADYLDWTAIRRINRDPLFDIGSHTVTHPWDPASNLVTWSRARQGHPGMEEVERELRDSRQRLEQELGHPITTLAWPCGWYNSALVQAARRAGYRQMLSYSCSLNRGPGATNQRVLRCGVDGREDLAGFLQLLRGEKDSLNSADSTLP